jgi:hypothetical protein
VFQEVPDIGAALSKVEQLGGTRLWGPLKATEQFELGQFTDPDGHMVGLVQDIRLARSCDLAMGFGWSSPIAFERLTPSARRERSARLAGRRA